MYDPKSEGNLLKVPEFVNMDRRTRSRSRQRDAPAQPRAQGSIPAASEPAKGSTVKDSDVKSKETAASSDALLNPTKGSSKLPSRLPSPNMSDPVEKKPSQKTRKRPRKSICNEKDRKGDKFFEFAQSVADHLKDQGYDEYEEGDLLLDIINSAKERKKAIDNHRVTHPDHDIKVIPFSSARLQDLPRIGVSGYHTINGDALVSQVESRFQKPLLSTITNSAAHLQVEVLPELRLFIGTLNEAGSRQVIDRILFQAWKACDLMRIPLFARLELSIPSLVNPIVREYPQGVQLATFISGRLDYAMSTTSHNIEDERESIQRKKQTIPVVLEGRHNRDTFSVIEAKADEEETDEKPVKPVLLDHLPQVLFECMGVPKEVTQNSSQKASFILANSWVWIFGCMDRQSGEVYLSDEISDMESIFKALIFWVTRESDEVYRMLEELPSQWTRCASGA
ncbi:hypothetical protein EYR38_002284 [Pleurotus pulmonarius]|nr:hypothetical protein EYR38_002284 [Pleurotus pulmonarius]